LHTDVQASFDAPRAALPVLGETVVAASARAQLPGCRALPLGMDASQVEALYPLAPRDHAAADRPAA